MPNLFGITFSGTLEFENRTGKALEILSRIDSFEIVKKFLACIREAQMLEMSGLAILWGTPTFIVRKPTWLSPLVWYASGIVHEAGHAKLYQENKRWFLGIPYTPRNSWKGKEAEKKCLKLQLTALRELKADDPIKKYVEFHLENPTHQNIWFRWW